MGSNRDADPGGNPNRLSITKLMDKVDKDKAMGVAKDKESRRAKRRPLPRYHLLQGHRQLPVGTLPMLLGCPGLQHHPVRKLPRRENPLPSRR